MLILYIYIFSVIKENCFKVDLNDSNYIRDENPAIVNSFVFCANSIILLGFNNNNNNNNNTYLNK